MVGSFIFSKYELIQFPNQDNRMSVILGSYIMV